MNRSILLQNSFLSAISHNDPMESFVYFSALTFPSFSLSTSLSLFSSHSFLPSGDSSEFTSEPLLSQIRDIAKPLAGMTQAYPVIVQDSSEISQTLPTPTQTNNQTTVTVEQDAITINQGLLILNRDLPNTNSEASALQVPPPVNQAPPTSNQVPLTTNQNETGNEAPPPGTARSSMTDSILADSDDLFDIVGYTGQGKLKSESSICVYI